MFFDGEKLLLDMVYLGWIVCNEELIWGMYELG